MNRKHLLAVAIVFAACLIWLAVFCVCNCMRHTETEVAPVEIIRQEVTEKRSEDRLPPVDHLAVVLGGNQSTADKIKSVDLISDDLSATEQQTIIDFIADSPNGQGEYVVKNNLLNRLVTQKTPWSGMNAALIGIASDRGQDIVVRAYVLQHLRPIYERSRDIALRDFLYDALLEENTEVSGGAMLALNYLMNQDEYRSEFDREPVIQQARKMVIDENANNNNRITAIQIASTESDPELADTLRAIIHDEKKHSALRISAIAGLGAIGDESDLALLKDIAQSKKYERKAAASAIRKIAVRIGVSP